jgi:iron-sulfur cluster repair protein YtfE (RIC family)
LSNHFHEEENYLFPLLGIDNKHIQQALDEHSKLKQIILQNDIEYTSLSEFALMLNNHIRFEERILFNEIQQKVSVNELKMVEGKFTHTQFIENEKDEFWITK